MSRYLSTGTRTYVLLITRQDDIEDPVICGRIKSLTHHAWDLWEGFTVLACQEMFQRSY